MNTFGLRDEHSCPDNLTIPTSRLDIPHLITASNEWQSCSSATSTSSAFALVLPCRGKSVRLIIELLALSISHRDVSFVASSDADLSHIPSKVDERNWCLLKSLFAPNHHFTQPLKRGIFSVVKICAKLLDFSWAVAVLRCYTWAIVASSTRSCSPCFDILYEIYPNGKAGLNMCWFPVFLLQGRHACKVLQFSKCTCCCEGSPRVNGMFYRWGFRRKQKVLAWFRAFILIPNKERFAKCKLSRANEERIIWHFWLSFVTKWKKDSKSYWNFLFVVSWIPPIRFIDRLSISVKCRCVPTMGGGSGRIYLWPTLTPLPVDTRQTRWSTLVTVSVDSKHDPHWVDRPRRVQPSQHQRHQRRALLSTQPQI